MVDFKKIGQALFRRPPDQLPPIEKERPPIAVPASPVLPENWGEPTPAGKRRGSQKRQRTKAFNIGMTEAEFAQAEDRARRAGLSNAAYGRACVLGEKGPRAKRAPPLNHELLSEALASLNRVGNNLNQIAKQLNSGGHPDRAAMADARSELTAILELILNAIGRVP